jgi:integrase
VRNLLKRLAERCELERRVHPHALRHTHAFELSMEGQPMNLIQHQLGHTSLATTGRYLDHIAPQARAAAMASRTLPPELDDAA